MPSRRPSASKRSKTVHVRLTEPAFEDLGRLVALDPQIGRWAFKKMLLILRDPFCGQVLRGPLHGWRKLVVGNRDWRVVWRVVAEDTAMIAVDVGEVWAVGARSDDEVYDEMKKRVSQMKESQATFTLAEVIERFGNIVAGISSPAPSVEPGRELLPNWLVERLRRQVGLPQDEIDGMDLQQAVDAWTDWQIRQR